MNRIVVLFAAFLLSVHCKTVGAFDWSNHGQRVIASICYQRLSTAQRRSIIAVLKQHPRFDIDFVHRMPPEIENGGDAMRSEWIFQQAAISSQVFRPDEPQRHAVLQGGGHLNEDSRFLDNGEHSELKSEDDAPFVTLSPAHDSDGRNTNVVKAINNSLRILKSDRDARTKAVHICSILHWIGDLHQLSHLPMFSSRELIPDGARVGNWAANDPASKRNWIGVDITESERAFIKARNMASTMLRNPAFTQAIESAIGSHDSSSWLKDSLCIAKKLANGKNVVTQLIELEQNGDDLERSPILLSRDYIMNRRAASKKQVVSAGIRCAEALVKALRLQDARVNNGVARRSSDGPGAEELESLRNDALRATGASQSSQVDFGEPDANGDRRIVIVDFELKKVISVRLSQFGSLSVTDSVEFGN